MRAVLASLAILMALSCGHSLFGAEPAWHKEGATGWLDLKPKGNGKTGFTRLSSSETGITFTNTLTEWQSAANRVLENGSGVAIGDFDSDGLPDICFAALNGGAKLYKNLGNWRFEDRTTQAGIQTTNEICAGAVFADINGDHWPDLLISTVGHGVLCFMNTAWGQFTNATAVAGLASNYGSTTLALADIDGNGTLDLYVTNYRSEDIRDRSRVEIQRVNGQIVVAPWLRDRLFIDAGGLKERGEPDQLFLNDGKGHFSQASWTNGIFLDEIGQPLKAPPLDWGLTASFRDVNGDGVPDLYVCNDYWTPDRLWLNDGHGKLRAAPTGTLRHISENSMGVDFADIDRDGHPDFFVADMLSRDLRARQRRALAQTATASYAGPVPEPAQYMRNMLFHNRGDGSFDEIAQYSGVAASEWSWQPVFVDVDLDGYEDLIVTTGHTRDVQDLDATDLIRSLQQPLPRDLPPAARQQAFTRRMMEHARLYPSATTPIVTMRNQGDLKFQEMTDAWGTKDSAVHQGIAFGDLDGDGDLDFVVNNLNGECGIYRNDTPAARVAVILSGNSPNTQGIGAQVRLIDGPVPMQSQEMISGGRYLSGGEALLVFAARPAPAEMRLEITWRSGGKTVVPHVAANRLYHITEGP